METAEHITRLREEGELFARAATAAGLDAARLERVEMARPAGHAAQERAVARGVAEWAVAVLTRR